MALRDKLAKLRRRVGLFEEDLAGLANQLELIRAGLGRRDEADRKERIALADRLFLRDEADKGQDEQIEKLAAQALKAKPIWVVQGIARHTGQCPQAHSDGDDCGQPCRQAEPQWPGTLSEQLGAARRRIGRLEVELAKAKAQRDQQAAGWDDAASERNVALLQLQAAKLQQAYLRDKRKATSKRAGQHIGKLQAELHHAQLELAMWSGSNVTVQERAERMARDMVHLRLALRGRKVAVDTEDKVGYLGTVRAVYLGWRPHFPDQPEQPEVRVSFDDEDQPTAAVTAVTLT